MLIRATICALCALAVAPTASAASFTVAPGETLSAIAAADGTSVTQLEQLNALPPGSPLLAGSALTLPRALERYRVAPGDTLSAIAAAHETTPAALATLNGLSASAQLLAGAELLVPAGPTGVQASTPTAPRTPTTATAQSVSPAAGAACAGTSAGSAEALPQPTGASSTSTAPASTASPAETLVSYLVKPGDTLSAIALSRGTTVEALAKLNGLSPAGPLLAGTQLEVPALPAVAQTTSPTSAAAVRASIDHWAAHYGVSASLATAVAWQESGFNNAAVSDVGATGVMQITPATWGYVEHVLLLGESVPHTADGNVRIGVAYLHHLLHVFAGNVRLALAAYNQGPASVRSHGLLPSTKRYVEDVLALATRV